MAILFTLRNIAFRVLHKWAQRTETDIDDIIIKSFKTPSIYWIIEILRVIDDYLSVFPGPREAIPGDEFYFSDPTEFEWDDDPWNGISLKDYIIYELHVGTFTEEGTFESVIPCLSQKPPDLPEVHITFSCLLPL